MEKNVLSFKRRHVLGNLYSKCENITEIPVYLNELSDEPIGFADESLGYYMDAFSFHLPEPICKKLSSNGYLFAIGYEVSPKNNRKYKINHFVLKSPPASAIATVRKFAEKNA